MEHKKQHWVPQSYLKAWCDSNKPPKQDDYVWIISKDGSEIKNKAPKNIFYESDMYTIKLEDGTHILNIEHGLSSLESNFVKIRESKVNNSKPLSSEEKFFIIAFTAAIHSRTKYQRNWWRSEWTRLHKRMKEFGDFMDSLPPERRLTAFPKPDGSNKNTLSYSDVGKLAKSPLQYQLQTMINAEIKILFHLNYTILETNSSQGFITSDNPCVWFSLKDLLNKSVYRSPKFTYNDFECTMPISPKHLILFSWKENEEYQEINNQIIVDEFNKRTRANCEEYFVVNTKKVNPCWFL
jgi:hypothetical protein